MKPKIAFFSDLNEIKSCIKNGIEIKPGIQVLLLSRIVDEYGRHLMEAGTEDHVKEPRMKEELRKIRDFREVLQRSPAKT